jgi:hypothetical protein
MVWKCAALPHFDKTHHFSPDVEGGMFLSNVGNSTLPDNAITQTQCQHRLRAFDKKLTPKPEVLTAVWRTFNNAKLHKLHSLRTIVGLIKSWRDLLISCMTNCSSKRTLFNEDAVQCNYFKVVYMTFVIHTASSDGSFDVQVCYK